MVLFIPWRMGAERSGAAQFGFGGALLLDLLGPGYVASGCTIMLYHRAKHQAKNA